MIFRISFKFNVTHDGVPFDALAGVCLRVCVRVRVYACVCMTHPLGATGIDERFGYFASMIPGEASKGTSVSTQSLSLCIAKPCSGDGTTHHRLRIRYGRDRERKRERGDRVREKEGERDRERSGRTNERKDG